MIIDVKHIAKLANLTLEPNEENKFELQLDAILGYIEKLKEVKTAQTVETSQVTGLTNMERKDEAELSLSQEDAVNQANKEHNGLFIVPVILEEAVE